MTEDTRVPGQGVASRRRFLAGAGATMALTATPTGAGADQPGLRRGGGVGGSGPDLKALVYPIEQPITSGPYPEQTIARYSAAMGQWGVAFSGGGARAFSAALGQMRGLTAAGVVKNVGAISCVSGGSWFGSTYSYAPTSYSDATLLGPLVQPADITLDGLNQNGPAYLGSLMSFNLTNLVFLPFFAVEYGFAAFGSIPYDKVWARTLNDTLLTPYGLGGTSTFFTLNQDTQSAIQVRNPSLTASFQLPRTGRPFFIACGTQIYSTTQQQQTPVRAVGLPDQVYRSIEYTPLYSGAPWLQQQGRPTYLPYGGGYVESFAFDTPKPKSVSKDVVTVPEGEYPFLLSDAIGSSSAAIASFLAEYLPKNYTKFNPFPAFDYWPIDKIGQIPAKEYSFGDGGILENTGVVSLLRRGYKTIFAFVNSPFPIGSTSKGCVYGIDGQISRLFGLIPSENYGTSQSTQVFATDQYKPVAAGLAAARKAGRAPVYAGQFPILKNNKFGLEPYTPQIFWIYNDLNGAWFNQLQPQMQAVLTNAKSGKKGSDPYYLYNFPNYETAGQNLFYYPYNILSLTSIQVNLLADMWAYTVDAGLATPGSAFGVKIG